MSDDGVTVLCAEQSKITIEFDEHGNALLRQSEWPDDDDVILIRRENIPDFIDRLTDAFGIPSFGRPLPQAWNAGRAAELEDDQDDEDPAERKRKAAAERQRRRREKQRQRDSHGGSHTTDEPNSRDIDDGRVTTAPASPEELDFQGGEHQALTH
jgi:hypothetical protein